MWKCCYCDFFVQRLYRHCISIFSLFVYYIWNPGRLVRLCGFCSGSHIQIIISGSAQCQHCTHLSVLDGQFTIYYIEHGWTGSYIIHFINSVCRNYYSRVWIRIWCRKFSCLLKNSINKCSWIFCWPLTCLCWTYGITKFFSKFWYRHCKCKTLISACNIRTIFRYNCICFLYFVRIWRITNIKSVIRSGLCYPCNSCCISTYRNTAFSFKVQTVYICCRISRTINVIHTFCCCICFVLKIWNIDEQVSCPCEPGFISRCDCNIHPLFFSRYIKCKCCHIFLWIISSCVDRCLVLISLYSKIDFRPLISFYIQCHTDLIATQHCFRRNNRKFIRYSTSTTGNGLYFICGSWKTLNSFIRNINPEILIWPGSIQFPYRKWQYFPFVWCRYLECKCISSLF